MKRLKKVHINDVKMNDIIMIGLLKKEQYYYEIENLKGLYLSAERLNKIY